MASRTPTAKLRGGEVWPNLGLARAMSRFPTADSRLGGRRLHPRRDSRRRDRDGAGLRPRQVSFKPEVMDSKLLSRNGDDFKVTCACSRRRCYHSSEHPARRSLHPYRRYPLLQPFAHHANSRSRESRRPRRTRTAPGKRPRFLWRLDSYWRFEQRDGGTYVECEQFP